MKYIAFRCAWRQVIDGLGVWLALAGLGLGLGAASPRAIGQLTESYQIQATDILLIEVVNEPQLGAKEFRVSANGEVSYPFIGALRAAGRTTVEVQQEVKRLLELDYLVNAQVIVQVREFRRAHVAVFGQVNRPGLIPLPPEQKMSVMEAIAAAGGFTRLARTRNIELTRAGMEEPLRFRVEDLTNPERIVHVEPGDTIFVPESRI
ncbi:MAG: polysaccharide export protein [Verrucomicrobiae bacterium]|nr:polysaccharide export protein [Verrucomicrobiae bacterium]